MFCRRYKLYHINHCIQWQSECNIREGTILCIAAPIQSALRPPKNSHDIIAERAALISTIGNTKIQLFVFGYIRTAANTLKFPLPSLNTSLNSGGAQSTRQSKPSLASGSNSEYGSESRSTQTSRSYSQSRSGSDSYSQGGSGSSSYYSSNSRQHSAF